MSFPDVLEPYRDAGIELLKKKCMGEIAFSGPTYQIEVQDPAYPEPLWVFLQLDEKNEIKDLFCSCEASTEKGACAHMAAAALAMYDETKKPLHIRFENSLWHELFSELLQKCGIRKPKIVGQKVLTEKGTLLFSASKNVDEILPKRVEETEETSIKFSNVTEEEIENWRKGQPSNKLRYELSVFSDLAKWLFNKSPVVTFVENEFPHELQIDVEDVQITVPLQKEDLERLIPRLTTVRANLSLLDEEVVAISFDAKKGEFQLKRKSVGAKNGPVIGSWVYFKGKGFSRVDPIESVSILSSSEQIDHFLSTALPIVKKLLPEIPIDEVPFKGDYELYVDKDRNLHIQLEYKQKPQFIWGSWAYAPKKGFFAITRSKFKQPHMLLSPSEIDHFIGQHRSWLGQFKGFEVHVAKLEEEILFEVEPTGALVFHSVLQTRKSNKERIDLGNWVYVKSEGFYVKHFTEDNPPLPLEKPLMRHFVADFIRSHIDLLQAVPHFFAADCPVKEVGVWVRLKKRGVVEILPEYRWWDPKDETRAIFYDEFVYVPEKGFYRLPVELRPMHFARTLSSEDPAVWGSFFLEQLPKLKAEYVCKVDPRLERVQELALTLAPEGETARKISEWDLDIYWRTQKGKVALDQLIQSKKQGERFVPTEAGLVDLSEDRFHWLGAFQERRHASQKMAKNGLYRLDSSDFLRLASYDTIHVETEENRSKQAFKDVLEKLLSLTPTVAPEQKSLQCELRPYQRFGVEWLWFLFQHQLSGLLCDDMGVGKTHQAMGLMDAIDISVRREGKRPQFLVICPTSLVYHWHDKLLRFLPNFKVKIYVKTQRSLDDFPGDYDLFLTTYGIWRNESQKLKKYHFDVVFFDELQLAKNHISQIHAALLQVQADVRIGLTGTPIENQLRELKAVFDLVLPGYMPKDADFREFFVRPIERRENPERRKLLSRYVRPFILRRRKVDVLPDLPEKTEEMVVVELLGEQKNLYRYVASHQAQPLIQQLKDENMPIPYMHIFALISSLKQICNHPATYLKDVSNFGRYESGKWEAFIELLEEAMESQQKVVVFSQYLGMLDIIEAHLKKAGIGYAQIRGQTKSRGDEVGRFHSDPECKVFLGSLQAAGLGIDLTAASIVIHYDRWWNAARENQATDRVHRFGQMRGVQVFKLVTKGSIEDKIDLMITKKASLLEDVIAFDDHQIVKRLTRAEIISLLEGLPEE
jgi:hypothetical protein